MEKIINNYFEDLKKSLAGIDLAEIQNLVQLFKLASAQNRHIFMFGNGGSASTASHIASDLNKGGSAENSPRFKIMCLNDSLPTLMAYANDISYADVFAEQLKNFLTPGDLVIGLSTSGNSKNVLAAIEYANQNKAITFGLTGFDGGALAKAAQHKIIVKSTDVQKIEDSHLIIGHILMQILARD